MRACATPLPNRVTASDLVTGLTRALCPLPEPAATGLGSNDMDHFNATAKSSLFRLYVRQRFQMFPRFGGFGAVGIALEDFAPGGAVVGKLFCRAIEKKGDAFAVVAIEAVVIQVVTEFRRADRRQFIFGEAARGVAREFVGYVFGFARVHGEDFRAQERLRKRIDKSFGAHDAIEFV